MTVHGAVHWNELQTNDAAKAREFYAKTLGWTYQDMAMPGGTYTIASNAAGPVGGIFDVRAAGMPTEADQWFTHFAVDDVDAALDRLKAAGGTVLREPWDVPGVGRIAMASDINGVAIGLMTPTPPE